MVLASASSSSSSAAPVPSGAARVWQSKSEWEVLVENIAQSHARVASGIQLAIEKQWGHHFTGASRARLSLIAGNVVVIEARAFVASLQAYAVAKENEIRGVCSANYQEFVDSIEEIVRMKADVAKLQVQYTHCNIFFCTATHRALHVAFVVVEGH
jgi:hypothetical protein